MPNDLISALENLLRTEIAAAERLSVDKELAADNPYWRGARDAYTTVLKAMLPIAKAETMARRV